MDPAAVEAGRVITPSRRRELSPAGAAIVADVDAGRPDVAGKGAAGRGAGWLVDLVVGAGDEVHGISRVLAYGGLVLLVLRKWRRLHKVGLAVEVERHGQRRLGRGHYPDQRGERDRKRLQAGSHACHSSPNSELFATAAAATSAPLTFRPGPRMIFPPQCRPAAARLGSERASLSQLRHDTCQN